MEWTPRPLVEHLREQERHNVTVITVGSKYEVYVQSPAPSHMLTFRTLTNKVRGKYNCKEVFLRLPSCVLSSCVVYYCVCYCVGMYPVYICIFLHESADDYATHIYIQVYINIHAYKHANLYKHTSLYTYQSLYTYMHIYIPVNIYIYIQVYIYIYT